MFEFIFGVIVGVCIGVLIGRSNPKKVDYIKKEVKDKVAEEYNKIKNG